ncbi:amine dehydrogenase large subunit [Photobacterium ganghwense]|uniref:Methylamine dehydrogenase n=1 Tax=Photobacterium ganghwense TaxID=320778 RepID=A0A0J1HFZ5_9GAMM|nr:amine dehydrogenase large subunit [Photobacterium ganghwense]KLV10561.1 methylamine dehydrogenase [Photobacterium ganghwense]PSU09535.1 methylamine dehydrogenase [Photobacterium ganghwense]
MNQSNLLKWSLCLLGALQLAACSSNQEVSAGSDESSATQQATHQVTQPVTPNSSLPSLPIETVGKVERLPKVFPESWIYVDETSFSSMFGGKMILMDALEPTHSKRIKGMVDKSLIGNFLTAQKRNEFYVVESFHERGSRGKKTDWLVIYNKETLAPVKEVQLTKTRLMALPRRHAMAMSPDERFLYIANFSPAASFTVYDLELRKIVGSIDTPGCVLTFATGQRSITSLCSNGALLTTVLNKDGSKQRQEFVAPFFDTDKTPIFERPAIIDGIAYFPGFKGEVHEVDLSGEVARYRGKWNLVTEQGTNWRPGGLALTDSDDQGLFYVIMNPEGFDGSQTHGGSQIWVFDVNTKARIRTIDAPNWAVSMSVTRGENPALVVTNGEMNLDVIDSKTGALIQTLSDFGNITPLVVHKAY